MTTNKSNQSSNWQEFETYTNNLMEKHHIAGAAVAVSQNGQIIYSKGFGVRDQSTGEPVTPETIFGIASVSKSFTALAIMQLQDKGMLCVDDPVIKYIPEWKLPGVEDMSAIKVCHLLSHTTGVPPMRRNEELAKFREHLDFFETEQYNLLGKPKQYFSYCNDTFLLLGEIIQRLSGKLYRRYMTVNLLDAIGMNRSTYSLEELKMYDNVTVPYVFDEKTGSLEETQWPQLGNYEVGGGVRSNVVDLMKYAQVYLNHGKFNGKTIVSPESIHRMQKPVYKIGRNTYYGFALKITPDYSGITLVEHGGSQPGVSSNFGIVPQSNIGVAVLTNVSGAPADSIWLAAVNTALGLPIGQKTSYEPDYPMKFEDTANFCGIYKSREGGEVAIFADQGQVKIRVMDKEYSLRASSQNTLVYNEKGRDKVIKFYLNDSGKPWAVFFGMRMLERVTG